MSIISLFANLKSNPLWDGSETFTDETRAEAVHFLYQNLPRLTIIMTIIPATVVIALWGKVDHTVLLLWMMYALSVSAFRNRIADRYFKEKPATEEYARWGRYFTYTSFASGIFYGAAAFLFLLPDSLASQLFILVLIFGMVNGSVFVTSHWLESYYVFMLTTLGLTAIALFLNPNPAYSAIAVLMLINILLALVIGKKTNLSVLSSIQLRFENAQLVKQLGQSIQVAEDANTRKTRFLASASHDLRQPVHALGLFSEALSTENLSSKGLNTLSFLKQSVASLNDLLNSLLDISRLDAGIITPTLAVVDLSQLLQRLSHDFKIECESKNLTFRTRCKPAWVNSDGILLENIVRNLLSNAIRYTEQGGVLLNCRCRQDEVWLEVWDTGIGISPEEQNSIFDEFYQVNNAKRDRQQGLGLGLAIVDKQAKLLGHTLTCSSHLGKGSCFRLKLQHVTTPSDIADTNVINITQLVGRNILIIDDEEAILEGMRITLEEWGCQIMAAATATEAVSICKTFQPEIIISDFRLGDDITGIELIQQLRTQLKRQTPALLITGDTAPDRLQQAEKSDLILLHKPVQPAKLRAALNLL